MKLYTISLFPMPPWRLNSHTLKQSLEVLHRESIHNPKCYEIRCQDRALNIYYSPEKKLEINPSKNSQRNSKSHGICSNGNDVPTLQGRWPYIKEAESTARAHSFSMVREFSPSHSRRGRGPKPPKQAAERVCKYCAGTWFWAAGEGIQSYLWCTEGKKKSKRRLPR